MIRGTNPREPQEALRRAVEKPFHAMAVVSLPRSRNVHGRGW